MPDWRGRPVWALLTTGAHFPAFRQQAISKLVALDFHHLLIGGALYLVLPLIGSSIPFIHCLLFGALISPTDPIAVLSILKEAHIPKDLEIKITGESLFNDGVGVVLFLSILEIAGKGASHFFATQIGWLFLKEACGGNLWGYLLGYADYWLLRRRDLLHFGARAHRG